MYTKPWKDYDSIGHSDTRPNNIHRQCYKSRHPNATTPFTEYLKTKKTSNKTMEYQLTQANPGIITVVTPRETYQLTVER